MGFFEGKTHPTALKKIETAFVSTKLENLVISRSCFEGEGLDRYPNVQSTCPIHRVTASVGLNYLTKTEL